MPVLIDPPNWPGHGRLWSHLVSDLSLAELHEFAGGLGLRSFDADHYDVPAERHAAVVAAGAQEVSGRELIRRLTAAGLRVPKRKREWLVQSAPAGPGRVREVLASPFDHMLRLAPGGLIHVLDCRAGSIGAVTSPDLNAMPVGFVRERGVGGSEGEVLAVVYAINRGSASPDRMGRLTDHPLWPLVRWVQERL